MAVFELEQRYVPLIECQHVWQPWGVAGRYTLDEEEGNESEAPTCSVQRAHSWGGYAPYVVRRRFSRTEDMADDLDQLKEAAEREEEPQGASQQRISAKDLQDILLDEDEQISRSWSKPALEAKGVDRVFYSQSTTFSSEDSSPCFASEDGSPCFSSEDSSPFFSSEASGGFFRSEASAVSFSSETSSRQRRRRRASAAHRARVATEKESGAGRSEITTLMVQNVPYDLSREELLAEVERTGFPAGDGGYNFCHLPRVFKTGKNQGFAFLNFASQAVAERFAKQWHNSRSLLQGSLHRALRVKLAAMQGIEACEQFAQSKKMQRVKTGTFKPLVVAVSPQAAETDATVPASC